MTALATPSIRRLPLAAGACAVAALGAALMVGPGGAALPTLTLGIAAVALLTGELVRRGRLLMRSGYGPQVVLGVLASAVVAVGWSIVASAHAEFFAGALILATAGASILVLAVMRLAAERGPGQTPWQALTGGPTAAASARARLHRLGPVLTGALLLLLGLRALAAALEAEAGSAPRGAGVLTMVMLLAFVVGPALAIRRVFASTPGGSSAAGAVVARDEQVVAAHLHDSVLQTLSLIQRNAADPAKVSQLARQQERSLRDWLAGRDDTSGTTLAGAVRAAAQEVEDEQPGAVIEVVAVGDAPLDREADAMVRAGREAMRNAARHAGSPVRVFVEVDAGVRELFVRDTGAGFALAEVGEERRGVRDAIIGRMEHVGGTARVDSGPGGTEIALRLPPSGEGGSR